MYLLHRKNTNQTRYMACSVREKFGGQLLQCKQTDQLQWWRTPAIHSIENKVTHKWTWINSAFDFPFLSSCAYTTTSGMGNGNNNKNLLPKTFIDTKREHFSLQAFSTPRSINFWRNSGKSVFLPYSEKCSPSEAGRNLIYANNHTIFTMSHLRAVSHVLFMATLDEFFLVP